MRWALVAVLLAGCSGNAIFELELDLPPQPAGVAPLYAVVQVRNDAAFDADWAPVERLDGIPLAPTCDRPADPPPCGERPLTLDCSAVVSVVGDSNDLTRPLNVRVRYCEDPACTAATDATAPETRVVVERALYEGRYTQGRVCVDEVPVTPAPEPIAIARCDVRCREGDAVMHCRADGTHFCEDP